MCEYSSRDGFANEWHMVHLGSRAVGGAGAGAAVGYSSAGMLCTISGPLCLIVVVPAAIVGGVVGLAAGSVVDAVSAGPRPQGSPPPADISVPLGG